jgi:phosphoribosyl 1,2-cyclic phosphodiesterase
MAFTMPSMKAISLQSGSTGNCIYVQSGQTALLFDAGISGLQAQMRLARYGVDIRRCAGVFISHDHRDHVACAGVYQRKFGLPVYATAPTMEAARRWFRLGAMPDVRFFRAGSAVQVGGLRVETVPTPHDGADGVGFVVESAGRRVGVLTDLGHVFAGLEEVVRSLDGVFLESNYDPDMLRKGGYPEFLKARIAGPGGHLSNFESAGLLARAAGRLQWACLAHLSEENNEPQLALRTHRQAMGDALRLLTASRHGPVGVLEV